ncbi:MAG: cysteine desulfurase family protein [Bacteroidota bacterium]
MIYVDNNATTPLDESVLKKMLPYFSVNYGNAASNHKFGVEANEAVNKARGEIAKLINAKNREIIFTSGATESINLALKGCAEHQDYKGHIITLSTEHHAVLDTCKYLEERGVEVTYLEVMEDGLVNLPVLKEAFKRDTFLVCIMLVNNETGVIQPLKKIADIAHQRGALLMTDATQAIGKIPVDVNDLGIDTLAFSGHKFYGPKGIGGLFIRSRGIYKARINPILHGGGHERNLRSGTLNVPLIVGLGEACQIASSNMMKYKEQIEGLRNTFEKKLLKIGGISINGSIEYRLYNTSNVCFKGVNADAILIELEEIMASTGSACTSMHIEPSHVLLAMGLSEDDAYSSIRFSFGKYNTMEEVKVLVNRVSKTFSKLKAFTF